MNVRLQLNAPLVEKGHRVFQGLPLQQPYLPLLLEHQAQQQKIGDGLQ